MNIQLETLLSLDDPCQLAFAYLTCERLYPNYAFFSDNFNFGKIEIIRSSINFIRDNIFEATIAESILLQHLRELENNIPDPEKFNSILASSALDATLAITETLKFISDKKTIRLQDISTFALDTVDMYIQEKENLDYNDPNFENIILSNPLMQREMSIQNGIINYLKKVGQIDEKDLAILIQIQGLKGNLDL